MLENPGISQADQPQQDIKQLDQILALKNIAEKLSEEELTEIGHICSKGFEDDLNTREEWLKDLDDWTKLASQSREEKSFPWPNASNVKYPLVSTAAMQFAARAYPALIPSDKKVVSARVIGKDPDGSKIEKANRISLYMSYQFTEKMPDWEEEQDKMLMMLPIVGCMFKKTYYDPFEETVISKLIFPKDFVVNHWGKSLETMERKSEIIEINKRGFKERVAKKLFLDVELGTPSTGDTKTVNFNDDTTPYTFVEQHTYYDIDKDGVSEPYIITFERSSKKVVRIVARYFEEDIKVKNNKIYRIVPTEFYTKFGFIPNPDGGFYDIGFGHILGPINESVDTLINQLVDAGTLNNLNAGFIGKGLRIKMTDTPFSPGEWRGVNAMGEDLHKQIVPLPTKEPSPVLFQLLGTLITSGKELASIAEIFVGKMPGQNTPATTTMATIQEGMRVFTAIYKRLYRAYDREFKKAYRLNSKFLDEQEYVKVLDDMQISSNDFDPDKCDIAPAADPNFSSQQEKLNKAQSLLQLMNLQTLDPVQVTLFNLEALDIPNYQRFVPGMSQTGQPQVQQPPDPKQQELQLEMQAKQQEIAQDQQNQQFNQELSARDQMFQHAMQAQKNNQEQRHTEVMNRLKAEALTHKIEAQKAAATHANKQK